MDKSSIEKMSFREKEDKLNAIFHEYRIAKFYLENDLMAAIPSTSMMVCESKSLRKVDYEQKLLNHIGKQNNYRSYVFYVDSAIVRLFPPYRILIEKEFIEQTDKFWWENYYSRTTFYRYKKEAMDAILSLLCV